MSARNQVIVPSVWFHTPKGKLRDVVKYYRGVFGEAFAAGSITPLGKTPSGNAELCEVSLFKQPYSFMSTEKRHHPLNDAISLSLRCKDQAEIDHYWDYFTKKGKAAPCGWCIDYYGLRWQVVPKNMGKLMSKPGAWQVMMRQKKIIIAEY